MITNNWKKMLTKVGKTQNELALAIGMNKGEMSRVCAGTSVPAWDALCECCKVLRCAPLDIYGEAELNVMYQTDIPAQPKKRQRIRVQLDEDVVRLIDEDVSNGNYANRREAVNELIRQIADIVRSVNG